MQAHASLPRPELHTHQPIHAPGWGWGWARLRIGPWLGVRAEGQGWGAGLGDRAGGQGWGAGLVCRAGGQGWGAGLVGRASPAHTAEQLEESRIHRSGAAAPRPGG